MEIPKPRKTFWVYGHLKTLSTSVNPLHGHKNAKSGQHFVDKCSQLLRYFKTEICITEWIVSSVANQRAPIMIECLVDLY